MCAAQCASVNPAMMSDSVAGQNGGTVETWKRSFLLPVRHTVETSRLGCGGSFFHPCRVNCYHMIQRKMFSI
ncbi:hypothetical protein Q8A67_000442 [Cirrhinus molitorella]|uniref:Uncharacterized protein n=1 Tax=Cirrhinus molitorella TaxID=172907 RepID=A0AA88QFE6_9TELE|nr:hypothetical protein Q8A67_000442 [Cirrhinus molitorella]